MQPYGQPPQQWNQPGYPQPPQGGYPPQQPYGPPQQPYGPPQGYGQPGGWKEPPWTVPGWGSIPGVIGSILIILGFTALDWVPNGTFIDVMDAIGQAAVTVDVGYAGVYAVAAWALAIVQVLVAMMWTLGFVRGPGSSFWLLGCRSKRVRAGRPGLINGVLAGVLLAFTIFHFVSWLEVFGGHLDMLEVGAWVVLAGLVLSTIGVAIGPRVPDARKAMFGYR